MKTVYHYTCLAHLPRILEMGFLKTTESNVSIERENAGPKVVWLTTDAECKHGHGIGNNATYAAGRAQGIQVTPEMMEQWDKTRVRFTVRLPNNHVHKWVEWSQKFQMDALWRKAFIKAAGGGTGTWRVVEHPILQDRWVEVIDRHTGENLWTPRGRRDIPSKILPISS
jgi:hypothetical protein